MVTPGMRVTARPRLLLNTLRPRRAPPMASTLSVSDWKKQLKDHPKAEEAVPLTKALEEFVKVDGKATEAVPALEVVITRAKAAKKKNAKNKDLAEYLDDVIVAA